MLHLLGDLPTLAGGNINYFCPSLCSSNCSVYCFLVSSPSCSEFPLMHVHISTQPKIQGNFCKPSELSLSLCNSIPSSVLPNPANSRYLGLPKLISVFSSEQGHQAMCGSLHPQLTLRPRNCLKEQAGTILGFTSLVSLLSGITLLCYLLSNV